MKKLITPLFILFSISCFSQKLEKVAEIEVSEDTKVFTFKLNEYNSSAIKDVDPISNLDAVQQKTLTHFLTLNGVNTASFDNATKTFTVVTKKNTNITLPLNIK